MTANDKFYHYRQIRSLQSTDQNNQIDHNIIKLNVSLINENITSSNICSTESINIDTLTNESHIDPNIQHDTSITITPIDIIQFTSSWTRKIVINNHDDDDKQNNHPISLNMIQIIFTIPYTITNISIYNKTVFIIDVIHNQLLATLIDICINESSFIINYSTIKPLPHNICLYLLLNLTLSTTLREIIFCRTIDDLYNNTSLSYNQTETNHGVGPSQFFILSQCIIILIMMFIIYAVQTARQKNLVNRASQRLVHSRPYMTIFGNRTVPSTNNNDDSISLNPATTLQRGLNHLIFHRQLSSLPNHQISVPVEEQVLAASDLTSTIFDRRATRPHINRDLIDVKEFTRRMSVQMESPIDTESNVL
ncbi:unnamed protein product [Rotaria sordida]|uniref:Uncharacterized protein n=1 Tax=Rotaria sordida TaxID=392033 RepID=A0A818G510_9BILA|nr:unnamed protein product [Rotaria sordida]CAF0925575.1 unnamed protein product [Rotaria sordida]CAF3484275.1 unnamed protein product [Rotaria sordida]CAF3537774.1 unnamed protein product [Rotaria sordida]